MVVWPEETLNYDPRVAHTDWIPALVRQTGVFLAMGFTPNAEDGAAPNTGLLWSPQGDVTAVYLKTKRVLVEGEKFPPGTQYPTIETPTGHARHDHLLRHRLPRRPGPQDRPQRAQMILAPSIDFASVADVRAASTAFRAIENRVAMVKADVAWDSVIVAPNGRVVDATAVHDERGGQALLVADVPLGPRGAPFTRFGGVPFQWLTYGALLLLIGAMEVSGGCAGRQPAPTQPPGTPKAATRPARWPRGRLRARTTPRSRISSPQTPRGSSRSGAAVRHFRRIGHPPHSDLANSRSDGHRRTTGPASAAWHGSRDSSSRDTVAGSPLPTQQRAQKKATDSGVRGLGFGFV